MVELSDLSFDGRVRVSRDVERYREDFDAFVNPAAEEMNGGDKGEVTFFTERVKVMNARLWMLWWRSATIRGQEELDLVMNEDESNEKEDKTLPFGVAMGLGGILDPRNKGGNNSSSNSGNTEFQRETRA